MPQSAAALKRLRRKYHLGEFSSAHLHPKKRKKHPKPKPTKPHKKRVTKSRATSASTRSGKPAYDALPSPIYEGPHDPYPPLGVKGGYWNSPAQRIDNAAALRRARALMDLIDNPAQ